MKYSYDSLMSDLDNVKKSKLKVCDRIASGEDYAIMAKEAKDIQKKFPSPKSNKNAIYFQIIDEGLKRGEDLLTIRQKALEVLGVKLR